jgi:hypothetical protein
MAEKITMTWDVAYRRQSRLPAIRTKMTWALSSHHSMSVATSAFRGTADIDNLRVQVLVQHRYWVSTGSTPLSVSSQWWRLDVQ